VLVLRLAVRRELTAGVVCAVVHPGHSSRNPVHMDATRHVPVLLAGVLHAVVRAFAVLPRLRVVCKGCPLITEASRELLVPHADGHVTWTVQW